MADGTLVLRESSDGVARLTVNRPDKLNALNAEVLDALCARFAEVGADPEVRAIVLTGVYAAILLFGWPLLAVVILGLADALFDVRGRVARRLKRDMETPKCAEISAE